MMMHSKYLKLIPLEQEGLESLLEKGTFSDSHIDFTGLEITLPLKRAIGIKLKKMKEHDPDLHPWLTYWLIVDRKSNKAMGFAGFKGLEQDGSAEIGYGISSAFEGRGHMTDAVTLLTRWALSRNDCRTITARNVLKTNIGSQKVLEKNGFVCIARDAETLDYMRQKAK